MFPIKKFQVQDILKQYQLQPLPTIAISYHSHFLPQTFSPTSKKLNRKNEVNRTGI